VWWFFILFFYFFNFPHIHTIYILKWGRKKKALPTTLKQFYIILHQIPTIYKWLFQLNTIHSFNIFFNTTLFIIISSFPYYFFNLNLDSLRKVRNPITLNYKTRIHFINLDIFHFLWKLQKFIFHSFLSTQNIFFQNQNIIFPLLKF
jgi:hypothetical protein